MSRCNRVACRSRWVRGVVVAAASAMAMTSSVWAQPEPQQQPLQQEPPPPSPPSPPQQVAAPPQPIACDECVQGEEELRALGSLGYALRNHAPSLIREWVPLKIVGDALEPHQDAGLREHLHLRYDLHQAIRELRDKTDEQVLHVAYALCQSPDPDCARYLAGALLHVRDIDPGTMPVPEPYGLPPGPGTCDPYVGQVKSPKVGAGFEYATGWQDSARPADGRVWSLGVELRARLRDTWGLVARVDRSTGRDAATDEDGDGRDDIATGAVTRWTALVGPTLRLHTYRSRRTPRYWQVDSLVGLSRSGDQSGPVTALDISYQLVVARLGVRVLQGFGDARDESAILVHSGLSFGAGPQYSYGAGCGQGSEPPGSAWAIALDIPLGGYAHGIGSITPGFGLEGALHVNEVFDGIVRADLLAMPSGDQNRALHQTVLAGGRLDFSSDGQRTRTGIFTTLAVGYAHVATTSSASVQSGPVADVSIGWGGQGSDGAGYLRLHGRFGLTSDTSDVRAVFLSAGLELRLDRRRWRDRG